MRVSRFPFPVVLLVPVLAAMVLHCNQREQPAAEPAAQAATAQTPPQAVPAKTNVKVLVVPEEGPTLLQSARIRSGSAILGEGTASVSAGEPLDVEVMVTESPEALAAWVTWIGPDGSEIATQQQQVGDDRAAHFRLTETSGWKAGDYEARIYVGGHLGKTVQFRVE